MPTICRPPSLRRVVPIGLALAAMTLAAACGDEGKKPSGAAPVASATATTSVAIDPAALDCGRWAPSLSSASNPYQGGVIVPEHPVAAVVCRYPLSAADEAAEPYPGALPLRVSARLDEKTATELAARINAPVDISFYTEAEANGTLACGGVGTNVAEAVFFQAADGSIAPIRFDFDQCTLPSTPDARKPVGAGALDDISALLFPDGNLDTFQPSLAYTTDRGVRVTFRGEALLLGKEGFAPRLGGRAVAYLRASGDGTTEVHIRPVNHGKDRLAGSFRGVTGMDWDDDYNSTLAVTDATGLHVFAMDGRNELRGDTIVTGPGLGDPAPAASTLPIAFTRTVGTATDIYAVDAATRRERRLTTDGRAHGPLVWVWPRLAYTHDRALSLLDPETGKSTEIAAAPKDGTWRVADVALGGDRVVATMSCTPGCSRAAIVDLTLGTIRDLGPGIAIGLVGGSAHNVYLQSGCDGLEAGGTISLLVPESGTSRVVAEAARCDASVSPTGFG